MRTTVRLDEDLLRRAKVRAAETGTTLTALIEQGLVAVLQRCPDTSGVREDAAVFEQPPAQNPLEAMPAYDLPPPPTSSAGFLGFVTDPIELAKAIEYECDRASSIRSGGTWPG